MKRRIKLLLATLTLVFAFTGLTGCMYVDGNDGCWHSWGPNCNDTNFTGMDCNEYGWFYFQNGVLDWNYTGMACNEYGWWYFRNGQLDWNYTGWGYNMYGAWLYWNGSIAFWYTGEYDGYYVSGGHRENAVYTPSNVHIHEWVNDDPQYTVVHHDAEYCDCDYERYDIEQYCYKCASCDEIIWMLPQGKSSNDLTEEESAQGNEIVKKHFAEECIYKDNYVDLTTKEGYCDYIRYLYYGQEGIGDKRIPSVKNELLAFLPRKIHETILVQEAWDEYVQTNCGCMHCATCGTRL